jgi:hypothetical protein
MNITFVLKGNVTAEILRSRGWLSEKGPEIQSSERPSVLPYAYIPYLVSFNMLNVKICLNHS